MKYLLFLVLAFFASTLNAQSAYMSSVRSAFSLGGSVSVNSDVFTYGTILGFTFNSSLNIGFAYSGFSTVESLYEDEDVTGYGKSYSYFVSALLSNQVKGDNFNTELGFIYSKSTFDFGDIEFSNTFGVGLAFSKQGDMVGKGYYVPSVGINFYPIVDGYDEYDQIAVMDNAPVVTGFLAFGYVFLFNNNKDFLFEPSLNYNFTDEVFAPGLTAIFIF